MTAEDRIVVIAVVIHDLTAMIQRAIEKPWLAKIGPSGVLTDAIETAQETGGVNQGTKASKRREQSRGTKVGEQLSFF
jgi:hypothetical protein